MSILAVLFVFFFDLVLVAGFRVFHKQLSDRFYKRCAIAFSLEALSTLILFIHAFIRPPVYQRINALVSNQKPRESNIP